MYVYVENTTFIKGVLPQMIFQTKVLTVTSPVSKLTWGCVWIEIFIFFRDTASLPLMQPSWGSKRTYFRFACAISNVDCLQLCNSISFLELILFPISLKAEKFSTSYVVRICKRCVVKYKYTYSKLVFRPRLRPLSPYWLASPIIPS